MCYVSVIERVELQTFVVKRRFMLNKIQHNILTIKNGRLNSIKGYIKNPYFVQSTTTNNAISFSYPLFFPFCAYDGVNGWSNRRIQFQYRILFCPLS